MAKLYFYRLLELAQIYDYELGDKAKAKELYKKIIFDYQNSIYVVEARKRFRELDNGIKIINIDEEKLEFETN